MRDTLFFLKISKHLILLILCLSLALLLTSCSDNLSPYNVASQYLQNEASGNYASNYDFLTSDSQLKIGRNEYALRLNQARQDSGIVNIAITRVEENPTTVGNRASVPYQLEITLQDGKKFTIFEALVMLHQDTGWRVIWPPE